MRRTRSGQEVLAVHQHVGQFADSTGDFRRIDILTLNVVYADTTSPDEVCAPCDISKASIPNEVYVSNMQSKDIRRTMFERDSFDKLDYKIKTFVQLMNYIMENEGQVRGTEESRTDAFVNHMLEKLGFGEYPLMIQPQPLFKFSVHTKDISSKSDFAIIKDRCIMLVDEDKHIRNTGPASAWGEYQIAGKLIAGAYCNYSMSSQQYKGVLYAVRVIGLKFTFYKADITPEYLNSLGEGFPTESITIKRYPDAGRGQDFPHLDYTEANDRKEIVDMLIRMKSAIV